MKATAEKKKIALSALKSNDLTVVKINADLTVLVYHEDRNYKVLHDMCPHMGGPLSIGSYCTKDKTITCPWHGYVFSLEDCTLIENPNEKIWIKPLAGIEAEQYHTPKYRLRELKFEISEDSLIIQE